MLRWLPLIALCPTLAFADDITLSAPVTEVTIHPEGATITRQVSFSLPAGQHNLILQDLPNSTPLDSVRVSVTGAALGTVTLRDEALLPRDQAESAELAQARQTLRRIEEQIATVQTQRKSVLLPVAAADAIATYLSQLGRRNEDADIDALRQTARMIGEETTAANQAALEAQAKARALSHKLEELEKQRHKAEQTVIALDRARDAYVGLTASVRTETHSDGTLKLTYVIDQAFWQPVYDIHLTRGDTPSLSLKRGAYVVQDTGEDWSGVALSLSTARPLSQTQPSVLYPTLRRIEEPEPPIAYSERTMARPSVPMAEPMVEVAEAAPVAILDGISVTYGYPLPVDIASGADKLRLAFGEVMMTPQVYARAIPQLDETAFVMADVTNGSGEIILPSASAFFYLDGQFTGTHSTDLIADGAEATFSFGAIEGIRLTDTVLDRNEGDRGVISRSNEITETRLFEVENLTGEDWVLRLQGRVPYSVQEDLVITWSARPEPQEKNLDGRHGILEWHMTLAPQSTRKIRLEKRLSWPDGMELR